METYQQMTERHQREANAPVEVWAAYMRARREHYRLAEENGWY